MKKVRILVMAFLCVVALGITGKEVSANPSGSEDVPTSMVMTPTVHLNVRSAAGTHGNVVGVINPGEEYTVTEAIDGWFLITYKDEGQFVYGSHMHYLRNADGNYDEQLAATYAGVDLDGNVYHNKDVTANENHGGKEVNANNGGLKEADIDMLMKSTANVNVRTKPSTSGEVVKVLKEGDDIHVTGLTDSYWYQCDLDGKTVYVYDDYLVPDFPQTMEATHPLNVRVSPNTDEAPVGSLQVGEKIKVSADEDGWYRFTYEKTGKVGYVFYKYVRVASGN